MNVREFESHVADLTASLAKQASEVLETAISQLREIRAVHLRELEAITADFCGTDPPDTVAMAEEDQHQRAVYTEKETYHARHERH